MQIDFSILPRNLGLHMLKNYNYMRKRVYIIVLIYLCIIGCKKEKGNEEGVLAGIIYEIEGECFSGPQSQCDITKTVYPTTVVISKPTSEYDESLIVKKIETDSNAFFCDTLPVGMYSVFFLYKKENSYVCFDYCTPLELHDNIKTTIEGEINRVTY